MSLLRVNTIRNKQGTGNPDFDRGLSVSSGISTLGTIKINSGIITASTPSGVVTYYGDGSNLTGVNEFTVGIDSLTNSTVYPTFASNTGVSSVSIATTQLAFIPSSGNLGIGSTLPKTKLDVNGNTNFNGNANFNGIVTATHFSGIGSQITGIVTSIIAGSGISISGSTGIVSITTIPQVIDYKWQRNAVGISTSEAVGIGTTNPQGSLQVGTGVTIYGDVGIVSATNFYGNFIGTATNATNCSRAERLFTVPVNSVNFDYHLPYVSTNAGYNVAIVDGRGTNFKYNPVRETLLIKNISVGSTIESPYVNIVDGGTCDGDFSVGIGTTTGIILTADNGNKYRLSVSDAGVLQTDLVS